MFSRLLVLPFAPPFPPPPITPYRPIFTLDNGIPSRTTEAKRGGKSGHGLVMAVQGRGLAQLRGPIRWWYRPSAPIAIVWIAIAGIAPMKLTKY
jgi:hypothetical protein